MPGALVSCSSIVQERRQHDEKFVRLDTRRLCELTSAADALDMKPLVDLTSRALARLIEGKTPEEIRETFHLPDDLTAEEKLEPVTNLKDDPRIRLLNRLYARKRRDLQELRAPSAAASAKEVRLADPQPAGFHSLPCAAAAAAAAARAWAGAGQGLPSCGDRFNAG